MPGLPSRRQRIALIALTLVMVSALSLAPRPAEAGISTTIADIPRTIFQAIDKVAQRVAKAFKISGDIAFKSSAQMFTNRLLQEVQTQLATVGPGQKPLFLTNPKKFFKQVTNSAAGDFIDEFSRGTLGETGPGLPLSGERGRFLISRLLRAQAGQVISGVTSQCKASCEKDFSVDGIDIKSFVAMPDSEFNDYSAKQFRNEHEWNVIVISRAIDGAGGTQELVNKETSGNIPCMNIDYTKPFYGSTPPYRVVPGHRLADPTTANDCLQAQKQALLNERSASSSEVNQCLSNCQVRGTAATDAIKGLTGTDFFEAYKNLDATQAPAALANALSNDKSDIGQFLNAAGTLTAVIQERVVGEQTNLNPNNLPVTTRVSEEVKTPSSAASQLFGIPYVGENGQFTYTGTSVADVLKGIASFINSPVGRAMANYFKSKCGLNPDVCKGPSNARSTIGQLVFGSGGPTGVAGAKLLYAGFGQPNIITGDPGRNEVNITEELTSTGLIDAQFRQAIESTMTVKEAVDAHLLDKQKTFGYDKNGVEPPEGYPFRALQYLRKYRITPVGWELAARYNLLFDHRDLSLGYLLDRYSMCGQDAAHRVCSRGLKADQSCKIFTDGTNDCGNDDNGNAITCGASPYCGLVDPNWVLKAPQTYCKRQGAGEEIVAKEFVCDQNNVDKTDGHFISAGETCVHPREDTGTPKLFTCHDVDAPVCDPNVPNHDIGRWVIQRNAETCADTQSCIAENDDGTCQAFGYCVKERQQFKFDGTQCSAENNSCTAYTDALGQDAAFLANTVDSRNCNAENAGCTQYCAASSFDAESFVCNGVCSTDPTKSCTSSTQCGVGTCIHDTINFTSTVQSCDKSQAGCHQFLRTTNGANLLVDGGFETWFPSTAPIDGPLSVAYDSGGIGWLKTGAIGTKAVTASDPGVAAGNKAAVAVQGIDSDTFSQIVHTASDLYERSFTFSIRAKAGSACSLTLGLEPNTSQGGRPHVPSDITVPNADVTTDWDTYAVTLNIPGSDVFTFAPGPVYDLKAIIRLGNCSGRQLVIDSAQLEESPGPTQFKDYGATGAIYLNGQRQQCTAADVGCQKYTPVAPGNPVYGQVRNSNRCSAENVGCGNFALEPITIEPTRSGGQVQIVVPRGQICSAADVGCEEYTNLDEVARGGEGKEYFKAVKQCIKPSQASASNPQVETFYTWVGDADLGYVLRAYDLVKSTTVGGAPTDGGPCMKLSIGTVSDAPRCEDTTGPGGTIAAGTCSATEVGKNPDCAEFYNSALAVYYRLRSRTISVTDECHPYRNTIDQGIPGREDFVYHLATQENVSCSADVAGCRAYTGNASGTTRRVFSDNFESNGTANWTGGEATNASTTLNGHSMRILLPGTPGAAVTNERVLTNQFYAGRSYILSFTAASTSATSATITAALGRMVGTSFTPFTPGTNFPGSITTSWNENITPKGPEWHAFTLGPLILTGDYQAAQLGITVTGADAYIDDVVLTEVNDHLYLIGSSVPSCPISEVGCAAYRDGRGTINYLTSFTRLCSEQVAGCEALIDTQNSSTPFARTDKAFPPDEPGVTTPADTIVTMVNNPAAYCPVAAKGCEAVGQPTYGPDETLLSYQAKYVINNPDRYSLDLCMNRELSCNVYTNVDGAATYFKDPGVRTCEFRSNSDNNGQWYITNTSIPCPTVVPPYVGRPIGPSCAPHCIGGDRDGKACVGAPGVNECPGGGSCSAAPRCVGGVNDGDPCNGVIGVNECPGGSCSSTAAHMGQIYQSGKWVDGLCTTNADCRDTPADDTQNSCFYYAGLCPQEQNGCTEYRDPSDPVSCRSECPLSQSQGGSPDYLDGSCRFTRCQDGTRTGQNCQNDADCTDASGAHSCVGSDGQPTTGLPGCRAYYYLRQSLETNAGACNGRVDASIGCRPFNDTTNPILNFRGF